VVHSKAKKTEIYGVRWLRSLRINAIVLWPLVLYADTDPNPELRKHEEIHLQQIKRDGVLRFYSRYLVSYCISRWRGLSHDQAYHAIDYEQEAYAHQENLAYQVKGPPSGKV
jgi:hypothetical protein